MASSNTATTIATSTPLQITSGVLDFRLTPLPTNIDTRGGTDREGAATKQSYRHY
jgi:hypothetical protein